MNTVFQWLAETGHRRTGTTDVTSAISLTRPRGGEVHEAGEVAVMTFVADRQASIVDEPGEKAFDLPSVPLGSRLASIAMSHERRFPEITAKSRRDCLPRGRCGSSMFFLPGRWAATGQRAGFGQEYLVYKRRLARPSSSDTCATMMPNTRARWRRT